jgi:hypothetical protein
MMTKVHITQKSNSLARKLSLLLALTTLVIAKVFAQTGGVELVNLDTVFPPTSSYPHPETVIACPAPIVKSISVVNYQTYTKVWVELEKTTTQRTVRCINTKTPGEFSDAPVQNGKFINYTLKSDNVYTLQLNDQCGKPTAPTYIDTKVATKEFQQVSPQLYSHIVKYLKDGGKEPFTAVLRRVNDVSMAEKLAFSQQVIFRGMPFKDGMNDGEAFPDRIAPVGTDTCFCTAIMTIPGLAPGGLNSNFGVDQYTQSGAGVVTPIGGDNNTRTWSWYANQGAAKWHHLFAEGFKSSTSVDYKVEKSWTDSTLVPNQSTWIRSTLFCLNGDIAPRDQCKCEKTIRFWFGYDAEVGTYAEKKDNVGNWSRNAIAAAEDLAIVSFRNEFIPSSLQILNFALTRTSSKCERQLNPDFWTNMATLAGNYAQVALSIIVATQTGGSSEVVLTAADAQTLADNLSNYFNSWATMLNTPYHTATQCDAISEVTGSLESPVLELQQSMRPNYPVVLGINSYSKLMAGGRRGFHANARINSNAWIVASIKPNAYDGSPTYCCSPAIGSWISASMDGPLPIAKLNKLVGDRLYNEGFFQYNPITGQLPKDWGVIFKPSDRAECNRIIVNPNGNNEGGPK